VKGMSNRAKQGVVTVLSRHAVSAAGPTTSVTHDSVQNNTGPLGGPVIN